MFEVLIKGIDIDARILSLLQHKGFDNPRALWNRIRDDFMILLCNDISDGKTAWPVDTGYSKASFYASDGRLYNHASYAPDVEQSTNAIASYIDNNLHELTDRALDFCGLPLQAKSGGLKRLLRRLTGG